MTNDPGSAGVVGLARDAAAAVRALNHLTLETAAVGDVADLYAVLGSLRDLAGGLPQLLGQLGV